MKQDGVRLEPTRPDFIYPGEQLRMRQDCILVEPLGVDDSSALEVVRHNKPVRGRVVAVGPGKYRREYSKDRKRTWLSDTFIPTQVKVGDIVELGGLDIGGYLFQRLEYHGKPHILATERDVCGVVMQES